MSFSNPWGLLALLLIIPIVLLYILKRQHQDHIISSTMLWQQVHRDLQATRPWQRLRTRLLLILQILAIIFFALSLARPTWHGGQGGLHHIAVVDTSARMQATDVKPNRMEDARNGLMNLIQGMGSRDVLTIVQAGQQPFILVGPSSDKSVLRQAAGEIQPSNGKTDLTGAVQLAQTILQDQSNDGGRIHVYSDHYPADLTNHENLEFYISSGNGDNAAITHVGFEIGNESINALSRVANYGMDKSITLELMIDGGLQNIKEVNLSAGEEVNVYWHNIPISAKEIVVTISEEDDLVLDNTGMAVVNEDYQVKALLATERNVFLERAISLREGIELYKVNPEETLEGTDFHLYIYDGKLPEQLPESGHILAFSPESHEQIGLAAKGEIHPARTIANSQSLYPDLLQYVEPEGYMIARANKIDLPEGFTVLFHDEAENPLLVAGEQEGRKIVIFSFALHDSNLPLKADFPILMQNLLNWLLPQDMTFAGQVFAGEPLQLQPFTDASRIIVTSPSGREYNFDAFPPPVFHDTNDIGVYKVIQQAENRTYTGSFVVSVPTEEVSKLIADSETLPGQSSRHKDAVTSPFRREIWMIAGWVLLLLLLTEWWVYHHGN